jgi:DNA-binding MarR family transcriptional regulator
VAHVRTATSPSPAPAGERDLVAAWRDILARHARMSSELDRALGSYGLGVSEFELLDHLAECEGQQRMTELGEAVHLSQSALSRSVSRLERDGLVTREVCAHDRRCASVTMTMEGWQRHAAALPAQRAVLAAGLVTSTDNPGDLGQTATIGM